MCSSPSSSSLFLIHLPTPPHTLACVHTHTHNPHVVCIWWKGMPTEVLKSTESHDLAPVEYFSALWNDSLFVYITLPERLPLCHCGGRKSEQSLLVVMAKLELNFSPLLHVGNRGAPLSYLLFLVLLFNFLMTLGKLLIPFGPQFSHLQNKEVVWWLSAWDLCTHRIVGHSNGS